MGDPYNAIRDLNRNRRDGSDVSEFSVSTPDPYSPLRGLNGSKSRFSFENRLNNRAKHQKVADNFWKREQDRRKRIKPQEQANKYIEEMQSRRLQEQFDNSAVGNNYLSALQSNRNNTNRGTVNYRYNNNQNYWVPGAKRRNKTQRRKMYNRRTKSLKKGRKSVYNRLRNSRNSLRSGRNSLRRGAKKARNSIIKNAKRGKNSILRRTRKLLSKSYKKKHRKKLNKLLERQSDIEIVVASLTRALVNPNGIDRQKLVMSFSFLQGKDTGTLVSWIQKTLSKYLIEQNNIERQIDMVRTHLNK